jgi:hypothetical protein
MALTLRLEKGSPLTLRELDDNFNHFTGSHTVSGSITAEAFSGSFYGTIESASYALTASYVEGTIESASYALTASYVEGTIESASYVADAVYTGSVLGNVLTFTQFDGDTFDITVDTGSGGGGAAEVVYGYQTGIDYQTSSIVPLSQSFSTPLTNFPNTNEGFFSTILNGYGNNISGSAIGGTTNALIHGKFNYLSGSDNVTLGGEYNHINSEKTRIIGYQNSASYEETYTPARRTQNILIVGNQNWTTTSNTYILGHSNDVRNGASAVTTNGYNYVLGNDNVISGSEMVVMGSDNLSVNYSNSFIFGQSITASANNTTHVENLQSTRDVYAGTSSARGLILTAPNGTQYRVTVDNSGNLVTTSI